ncbi:MAG: regulatory protein RecX [Candidatus Omnitrophica bacterium]|nr:regulatory protein RecX [Candidatus Omnitrophota bacterium]
MDVTEASIKKCLQYALRLLSISPRTQSKLEERLKEKGYGVTAVREVMNYLSERKLINDASYARAYVEEMTERKPCGRHRLKYELKRRGVKEAVTEEALSSRDKQSEYKLALELAKERAGRLASIETMKRKKRIYDFLIRRGFDFEVARKVIGDIDED